MAIKEIVTIPFTDADSGNEAVVVVRRCGDRLALAVSVRDNGDIEVVLDANTARRFADAVRIGTESIGDGDTNR
jgi:hypothetical protein